MIVDRILGDRVLLKVHEAAKMTRSGIVLPDRASHLQPRHATVRSVGFLLTPEGEYRKCLRVEPGEMVIVPSKGGIELDANGERLWVFDSADVLAVVKDVVQDATQEGFSPVGEMDAGR